MEGFYAMLTAFVMIEAEPDKIADVAQAITNVANVAEVYSVTGEFDILVVLRLSEYEQLARGGPRWAGQDRGHLTN